MTLTTKALAPLLGGAAAVVAGIVASQVMSDSQLVRMTLWVAEAVLALSLVLVWGRMGVFSLGQTALYGLGAYAYGVVAVNLADTVFLPWCLLAGIAVAVVAAAFIGYFVFYGRVSPINVAVITLAFSLVLQALLNNMGDPKYHIGQATLGGFNGLGGIPLARFGGADAPSMATKDIFLFSTIVAVVCFVAVAYLVATPFGRVAHAISSNEERAELLGYDVRRYRLLVFMIGGAIAGLAGGLYVVWGSFVTPNVFGLMPAILVVIWVLAGGRERLLGAAVGVFAVEFLTDRLGGSQGQYSPIYLGAALVLIVLLFPHGLMGITSRLQTAIRRRGAVPAPSPALALGELAIPERGSAPVRELAAVDVHKRFGGLAAVDGVSIEFEPQGIHCLIGPNGAGKSTLFALLMGSDTPTSGRVLLGGEDITRLPAHRRARQGIGIKLQTASIFPDLPVMENLWLAAYAATRDRVAARADAENILRFLGLIGEADTPAGALALGQQQWLEIGMVIAMRSSVTLLDEPTAGMSVEEAARTAELIKQLSASMSVVVIEHDMAFIRLLDAPVTVLHLGRQLAHGRIRDLERDDRVLDVYLGRHDPEDADASA